MSTMAPGPLQMHHQIEVRVASTMHLSSAVQVDALRVRRQHGLVGDPTRPLAAGR